MGPHANVLPSASRIRTIPGLPLASHALGSMGARFCSICKRPAQASLTHTLRVRSMCARHISPANRARGTSEGQQVLSCPRSSTASSSAVSIRSSRTASSSGASNSELSRAEAALSSLDRLGIEATHSWTKAAAAAGAGQTASLCFLFTFIIQVTSTSTSITTRLAIFFFQTDRTTGHRSRS